MFGELDDSDIYVNNQGDNFDEPLINEFAEDEVFAQGEPEVDADADDSISYDPQQQEPKADNKKLLIYVLVLVLLVAGAVGAYFYKMKSAGQDEIVVVDGQEISEAGDFFYDKAKEEATNEPTAVVDVELAPIVEKKVEEAAAAPDVKDVKAAKDELSPVVAAREQEKKELEKKNKLMQNKSKQVVIPVTNGGRVNPFMPYNSALASAKPPEFELIAPPLDIPDPDPMLGSLVSTKISGIMYDNQRPSAIINCGGSDHLVHKGDRVQGYQVIDITKDRVVLKYGTNIYRASVGQAIGRSGVSFNEVSNLNRQFGGAYSQTPSDIIEINGSN